MGFVTEVPLLTEMTMLTYFQQFNGKKNYIAQNQLFNYNVIHIQYVNILSKIIQKFKIIHKHVMHPVFFMNISTIDTFSMEGCKCQNHNTINITIETHKNNIYHRATSYCYIYISNMVTYTDT